MTFGTPSVHKIVPILLDYYWTLSTMMQFKLNWGFWAAWTYLRFALVIIDLLDITILKKSYWINIVVWSVSVDFVWSHVYYEYNCLI